VESAGQIGIELRLLMDKLKGDIAAAAGVIKKDLSGTALSPVSDKAAAGMDKASASAEKLATNIGKVASAAKAMKQRLADIASGKLSPVEPGMRIRGTADETEAANRQARLEELRRYRAQGLRGYNVQDFFRGGEYGRRTQNLATNPPPVLGSAKPVATVGSMLDDIMNFKLSPLGKGLVMATAALASLRVAIGLVKYAMDLLLAPMRAMFRFFMQAAEQARSLYATSLTSGGLPVGFVTRRSTLASIIGVSEQEVFAFAKSIEWLNPRIKDATMAIRASVPVLTASSWEWRAIQNDLKAIKMVIAADLAPTINYWMAVMKNITEGTLKASKAFFQLANAIRALYDPIGALMRLIGKNAVGALPSPEMSARRYPVSNWERLGLVLEGRGAGMEPAKVTANATKKTAENTGKLIGILMGMHAGGLFPTGVPVPSPSRP
jgi:hypothetical protein